MAFIVMTGGIIYAREMRAEKIANLRVDRHHLCLRKTAMPAAGHRHQPIGNTHLVQRITEAHTLGIGVVDTVWLDRSI